mmetsp:Transcript_9286/g.18048  ORF Transcript_9286/g.18048 Transcript_9286/m.18048 type:complete len:228 (-) Transcript_9286:380-1063(-)
MIKTAKASSSGKKRVSVPAVPRPRELIQEQMSRMPYEQLLLRTLEESKAQAMLDEAKRDSQSPVEKDPVIQHLMEEVARLGSLLQKRILTEALDYEQTAEVMQSLEMLKQVRMLYSGAVASGETGNTSLSPAMTTTTPTATPLGASAPTTTPRGEEVKSTKSSGDTKATAPTIHNATDGKKRQQQPAPPGSTDLLELVFDRQGSGALSDDFDESLFYRENSRSQRSR